MRKLATLVSLATIFLFFSCNKGPGKNTAQATRHTTKSMTFNDSLSVGDMHNIVLGDYLDHHWEDGDNPSTKTGYEEVLTKFGTICESYGWLDTPKAAMLVMVMDELDLLGIFNSDGTIKSLANVNAIMVASEPNSALRTVLININNYSGNDPDAFANYANDQFATLSLTGLEAHKASSVQDILNKSGQKWKTMGKLFDQLTFAQKVIVLMKADSFGATIGQHIAIKRGITDPLVIQAYMNYYAGAHSGIAARL